MHTCIHVRVPGTRDKRWLYYVLCLKLVLCTGMKWLYVSEPWRDPVRPMIIPNPVMQQPTIKNTIPFQAFFQTRDWNQLFSLFLLRLDRALFLSFGSSSYYKLVHPSWPNCCPVWWMSARQALNTACIILEYLTRCDRSHSLFVLSSSVVIRKRGDRWIIY